MGKYVNKDDVTHLYRKVLGQTEKVKQEINDSLPKVETDGGIDTMFDTYYDAEQEAIVFGEGCARFEEETGSLYIEGAVSGDELIIS